ncbi:hypothetical protein TrRE_jg11103, partial [Triparma retinervis]
MSGLPTPFDILVPFGTSAPPTTSAIVTSCFESLSSQLRSHYCASCFKSFLPLACASNGKSSKSSPMDVAVAVKEGFAFCKSIVATYNESKDLYQPTTSSFLSMLNKLPYTLMEDLFSLSKTDDLTSLVSRFLTMAGEDSSVVKEGVAGKGVETGK